jgi:hypothetical protein
MADGIQELLFCAARKHSMSTEFCTPMTSAECFADDKLLPVQENHTEKKLISRITIVLSIQ